MLHAEYLHSNQIISQSFRGRITWFVLHRPFFGCKGFQKPKNTQEGLADTLFARPSSPSQARPWPSGKDVVQVVVGTYNICIGLHRQLGSTPPVTTRMITFVVGNSYKPFIILLKGHVSGHHDYHACAFLFGSKMPS